MLTSRDITDVPAALVADPFLVRHEETWHMFFEIMDWTTKRGVIGVATSPDALHWTYRKVVLAEPFHLSYPYVVCFEGSYYMIPESGQAGSVRLYKAERFPYTWRFERVLVNRGLADASVFEWEGRWWMACSSSGNNSLLLFHADKLTSRWYPHSLNPVIENNIHIARPAGRVIRYGGGLLRFAQACAPAYGTRVWPLRITRLNTSEYQEELGACPVVGPGPGEWNREGMHHVDAHSIADGDWIAAVDGWHWA